MKLRWKILITIGAAMLYLGLTQMGQTKPSMEPWSTNITDLRAFYAGANQAYFGGQLPEDITIDLAETDPKIMASTTKTASGDFIIHLNKRTVPVRRTSYTSLLHEMCHVKTWDETINFHGPKWQACMLQVDAQGANRRILIDGYEGN